MVRIIGIGVDYDPEETVRDAHFRNNGQPFEAKPLPGSLSLAIRGRHYELYSINDPLRYVQSPSFSIIFIFCLPLSLKTNNGLPANGLQPVSKSECLSEVRL